MRNFYLSCSFCTLTIKLSEVVLQGHIPLLKMSWRRFCETFWRRLENVLKTSWWRIAKTNVLVCPRRLEDVLKRSSEEVKLRGTYWSWSRRLHQGECLLGSVISMILNMPLERLCELKTVVAWLKIVHLKTQQLVVIKQAVFFTMYFSFLIHDF